MEEQLAHDFSISMRARTPDQRPSHRRPDQRGKPAHHVQKPIDTGKVLHPEQLHQRRRKQTHIRPSEHAIEHRKRDEQGLPPRYRGRQPQAQRRDRAHQRRQQEDIDAPRAVRHMPDDHLPDRRRRVRDRDEHRPRGRGVAQRARIRRHEVDRRIVRRTLQSRGETLREELPRARDAPVDQRDAEPGRGNRRPLGVDVALGARVPVEDERGRAQKHRGDAARELEGVAKPDPGVQGAQRRGPDDAADAGAGGDDPDGEAAVRGEPARGDGDGGDVGETGAAAEEHALGENELPEVLAERGEDVGRGEDDRPGEGDPARGVGFAPARREGRSEGHHGDGQRPDQVDLGGRDAGEWGAPGQLGHGFVELLIHAEREVEAAAGEDAHEGGYYHQGGFPRSLGRCYDSAR
ncbi:hypothetical protein ACP6JC_003065 [Aspergillus fumigatus]